MSEWSESIRRSGREVELPEAVSLPGSLRRARRVTERGSSRTSNNLHRKRSTASESSAQKTKLEEEEDGDGYVLPGLAGTPQRGNCQTCESLMLDNNSTQHFSDISSHHDCCVADLGEMSA